MYLFNLRVITHSERKPIIKTRNMTGVRRQKICYSISRPFHSFLLRFRAVIYQGSQSLLFPIWNNGVSSFLSDLLKIISTFKGRVSTQGVINQM